VGEKMKIDALCSDLVLVPKEARANLDLLLAALNPIEREYIKLGHQPWVVTSGFRTMEEHAEIYRKKNEKRKREKLKLIPVPLFSQHLKGNAVDIYDPNQDVKLFVAQNLHLFEEAGIYFEAFETTRNWVHMQRVAPRSGKRFFIP
jgi:hypothetical protein